MYLNLQEKHSTVVKAKRENKKGQVFILQNICIVIESWLI